MKTFFTTFALACLLPPTATLASTVLYTNAPCLYVITSNSLYQAAVLCGTTGTVSGIVSVPQYVKSSLYNVTAIAPGAFKDQKGLTGFSLDASSKVTTLGAGAFWGCTNLLSVTLRDSVTEIGPSAFLGCTSLATINLSVATGITAIAEQTFSGCASLSALSLPSGLTQLGASAFRNASSLTTITVPSGVTTLPDFCFQGCRKLTTASFAGCSQLGIDTFAESGLSAVTIPAAVSQITQGSFADCSSLASVVYAGYPTSIGAAAFKNCASLTSVPLPSSASTLEATAFEGCTGLRTLTVNAPPSIIPENLFENCTSLASVALSADITSIGGFAFACCSSFTNVTAFGDAPTADEDSFEQTTNVIVYYYDGSTGWGNLLAKRPTTKLRADGSVSARSFAAWAVQDGLISTASLCIDTLETLFITESSTLPGVSNGAVYTFGENLTEQDALSLITITFDTDGTPIVETPALASDAASFVTATLEGTTDLSTGIWNLTVNPVDLTDSTRDGYTPAATAGVVPPTAFFRLKLSLN